MNQPFPDPKIIDADGVHLAIYEANGDPANVNPPIILVHGWPDIAHAWSNQIHVLADAGYRAITLDVKGFGQSDAPKDPEEYDIEHLTNDIAALLDALSIPKAIFCGHDWGGAIVWGMGQWRSDRVAGIMGVCTPLKPRPPAPPLTIIKNRFTENHYFIQFQKMGMAEALFASDTDRFVRMMFQKPAPRERWAALVPQIFDIVSRFKHGKPPRPENLIVSDEIIDIYVDAYRRSGFHGGVNLYRNIDRNWELMEGRDETVRAPALWIGADLDLFLPPETAEGMETIVPNLEQHIIAGSGHWLMWEKPNELNAILLDWLRRQNFN